MAIVSADTLRKQQGSVRTLTIGTNERGEKMEIVVKVPDLPALVFMKVVPLEMVTHVIRKSAEFAMMTNEAGEPDDAAIGDAIAKDEVYCSFMDKWVCASSVEPRIVPTEEDAKTYPNSVCVHDLRLETRMTIYAETFKEGMSRIPPGSLTFPRQPEGDAPREGREDVGVPTKLDARPHRPDGGARLRHGARAASPKRKR